MEVSDPSASTSSPSRACSSEFKESEACRAAGNEVDGREPSEKRETAVDAVKSCCSCDTNSPLDRGSEAFVPVPTPSVSPSCPNSDPPDALRRPDDSSSCAEVRTTNRHNSPHGSSGACSIPVGTSRLRTDGTKQQLGNTNGQKKKRGRRTQQHSQDSSSSMMEHSGISVDDTQALQAKRMRCAPVKNGVLQCLKLEGVDKCSDESDVSKELVRCLQETKSLLIGHVVRVLGAERSLELFAETADIQENGGTPTADGKNKKTPGGVFLTLVKNCASSEEKKEIFKQDKALVAKKKREIARHKREERMKDVTQQKAELTLQTFRMQLTPDMNMEKRLFGTSSTRPSAKESFQVGDGEALKEQKKGFKGGVALKRKSEEGEGEMEVDCAGKGAALDLEVERKLAEEFESTNSNFELGFQFEID